MKVLEAVSAHKIKEEVQEKSEGKAGGGRIAAEVLREVLHSSGVPDHETWTITDLLTSGDPGAASTDPDASGGSISVARFTGLLDEARVQAHFSSSAVSKFNRIIQTSG